MKIFYLGYYSDIDNNRKTAPAADTKIDYVLESLKSFSNDIELLSFCYVDDRSRILKKYKGYVNDKNGIKIRYFSTYSSKYRVIRVIGRFFTWLEQKKYIKEHCLSNNSNIIIYHSLLLLRIYKLLNKYKRKYTIEVEEIYSDVINKKNFRKKEIDYLNKGNKYIFPTKLLNDELNVNHKPYVIVHGTYKLEKRIKKIGFGDNKIHCVYAGTFDPRKGGLTAAAAAEYLPENYHIHVIGFGSPQNVKRMENEIEKIKKISKAEVSYDGLLTGDDYLNFIQSCNIGLSTQDPNAAFNSTSFPSKILSYMANGLRVVSIKIPAIESSKIGNYLYYYDKQEPKEIAKAIMNINMDDNYDSQQIIKKLDIDFKKELEEMLISENEL